MMDILQEHLSDARLGRVIGEAITFIDSLAIKKEHGPTGTGQSSKSVANLHAFRKQSGYYNLTAVVGLDETIGALDSCDAIVHLRVAETDKGYIALWLNDQHAPLGAIIFKTGAESGVEKNII